MRSLPQTLKLPLLGAGLLGLLWALSPARSPQAAGPGVTEIHLLGSPSGTATDALVDVIQIFEKESRAAHARAPSRPVYRVVTAQNATPSMSEDQTRFLLSVAGGAPPDVVCFDRFAIAEWAARRTFADLTPFLEKDEAGQRADAARAGDYFAPTWDEVAVKDPRSGRRGVFGIPDAFESRALVYNKQILRRAGCVDARGEARPPRTWEELAEMTTRLTEFAPGGVPRRLKGISESYYEAARIDGANAVQQFFSITLPMLSPYIFFNLIMGVIGTLQIFSQAFIITQGGPVNSTLFYVYHLFNQAFRYLNMGYASALALVLMLVVLILTVAQMAVSRRWVHYEGN